MKKLLFTSHVRSFQSRRSQKDRQRQKPGSSAEQFWFSIQGAVARRQLHEVDLSEHDLLTIVRDRTTIVHLLARANALHALPVRLLTPQVMAALDERGNPPAHLARKRLSRSAMVFDAAKSGYFANLELVPEDFNYTDNGGNTIVHVAAYWGHLGQIPNGLLTMDIMAAKNHTGGTPSSLAKRASNPVWLRQEQLKDAVKRAALKWYALTSSDLEARYSCGNTLAHLAAYRRILCQVPEELLTENIVLKANKNDTRVVDIISKTGRIYDLPREVRASIFGLAYA